MKKIGVCLVAPALIGAATLLLAALPAAAQNAQTSGPIVYPLIHQDVSLPLWQIAKAPKPGAGEVNIFIPENRNAHPFAPAAHVNDPVGDDPSGRGLVMTTDLLNFDGIAQSQSICDCAPPDTEGVVGATQFVQYVNTAYEVYDKTTGASVLGPLAGNSFWSGFGGACQNNDDGDPVVMYDKAAARWVFAQNVFVTPYTVCIAVSTSDDATGSYNRYAYSLGNVNFPDYPKWGVWPDGYYQTFNIFANGFSETGAMACSADRTEMLVGGSAPNFVCFQSQLTGQVNVLPTDLDGTTAPPAGAPNYYVNLASSTGNLNIWQFHVDFTTVSNSTFTGPTVITTAAFNDICDQGGNRDCIPQPPPGEGVDSLTGRMMYRLSYRNFGTYESILATHTVQPTGTSTAVGAVRWYEVRSPGLNPKVYQQGTLQTQAVSLWNASIAQDHMGNMAIGFSASSPTIDTTVLYTGRLATDKLGTVEGVKTVVKGTGVQEDTDNRWGDYSLMSVDPTDDCTFWYTQEYIKTTGSFNWNTRINSFHFNNCS